MGTTFEKGEWTEVPTTKKRKKFDPYHGSVYESLPEKAWQRKKKPERKIARGVSRGSTALVPVKSGRIIETKKEGALWVPRKDISHTPKKESWWQRRKQGVKKGVIGAGGKVKTGGKIAWKGTKWGFHRKGVAAEKAKMATRRTGETAAGFGYALPGPFQVFTLAWQKTTKALKALAIIVFALCLLFIPWGVFYYTGWAVGAAFMFLVSVIFWIFISLFNGIAFVLVSGINGIATIIMSAIIAMVDAILGALGLGLWENGRYFLDNALIKYSQIANVPSLYHIVGPTWESWMNNALIVHILGWFKVKMDLSWMVAPFSKFYESLSAEQAVIIGLFILAVPIIFLVYIYYKNRQHI